MIDPNAKLTRQALCTDGQGYWRILERPKTLQDGNTAAMVPVRHKNSSEIQRNTYGICGHLPRSKDYEAPFDPVHLIDGDPETCWSSQQNSSTYPGIAPWVEIDLRAATTASQESVPSPDSEASPSWATPPTSASSIETATSARSSMTLIVPA